MRCSITILFFLLGSIAGAQNSITVEQDVPCPKEYQIRYTKDGTPYVVVTKFERRKTGTHLAVDSAGVVRHSRAGHGGSVNVTLRTRAGLEFSVTTGKSFTLHGRRYKAEGWNGNHYVLYCPATGSRYNFSQPQKR